MPADGSSTSLMTALLVRLGSHAHESEIEKGGERRDGGKKKSKLALALFLLFLSPFSLHLAGATVFELSRNSSEAKVEKKRQERNRRDKKGGRFCRAFAISSPTVSMYLSSALVI